MCNAHSFLFIYEFSLRLYIYFSWNIFVEYWFSYGDKAQLKKVSLSLYIYFYILFKMYNYMLMCNYSNTFKPANNTKLWISELTNTWKLSLCQKLLGSSYKNFAFCCFMSHLSAIRMSPNVPSCFLSHSTLPHVWTAAVTSCSGRASNEAGPLMMHSVPALLNLVSLALGCTVTPATFRSF